MKRALWLSLFLLFCADIPAQSPFRNRVGLGAGISGGSLIGIGIGYGLEKRMPALSLSEINMLDRNQVSRFDRIASSRYSTNAKTTSDVLLFSGYALPLVLMADPAIRNNAGQTYGIIGTSFFATVAVTNLVKVAVNRPRPFVYNPDVPLHLKMEKDARLSFFSGHTSTVAAMSFSTAAVWQSYHKGSRFAPLVWTAAALLPAATGYYRVQAGKHFPSDVIAGYAVGALIGWGVPHVFRR